jgi:guanyl-specific ribonuclease Sa
VKKRVFAIALALVMLLSVVLGCTSSKKETPPANQTKISENQNKAVSSAAKAADQDKSAKQQKQNGSEKNVVKADTETGAKVDVVKGKAYTDKDHVAAYIHVFKTLPPNYITKAQASKLGWKTQGTLDKVAPGKSIGGDRFNNYEKVLPDKQGRVWKECDIDYVKGNRNAKRICYSNDGLIYYSSSHYQKFERMY